MRTKRKTGFTTWLFLMALAAGLPLCAHADDSLWTIGHDQDRLVIGAGIYDVTDERQDDVMAELEWQGAELKELKWGLHPLAGLLATGGGELYGYGGIGWDVSYGRLFFNPTLGIGLLHQGSGKDLGGAVELRSQATLGYRLPDGYAMGISYSHISNGRLYSRNPGTETLTLRYTIPF